MNLPTDGVAFITEETFDFGISFPAESQESLLENDAEEAFGPVRRSERCLAVGIDVNSNNGNHQKMNEGVLKWSPLSAEKLAEIVKEANRLANQFEKCALKEKENARRQGKEVRSCGDRSKLEKDAKAKIRLLQDERTWKKSPRSPRRDTYFVLDSPNKALLPSVDIQDTSENCLVSESTQAHPDEGLQTTICRLESPSESEQMTSDKPVRTKEGNLSTNSKQAAVKKQSELSRPSGLKLPSAFNRKGNVHSLSSSKPYEFPKKDLPLLSTGNLKQSRGVSLNNPVDLSRDSGRSTVLHSKQNKGKPPVTFERKMLSTPFKPTTATNIKQLPNTNRAASTEGSNRKQVSSRPIPPVSSNRLRPGSTLSARAGIKIERGTSEGLKVKGSEKQFQATVTSKHLNLSAADKTVQSRSQPRKVTSSNIKR
ncbi:G2 and S phase-expressed protein 1-like isoform X1 [Hemitrygon akajei]|uniref:G2 and S phase-expressed protein 1-like isoform X1 n=1 Tax=Hemitrygon akajei TaxID=2704970 RepID=UPI003BFA175E